MEQVLGLPPLNQFDVAAQGRGDAGRRFDRAASFRSTSFGDPIDAHVGQKPEMVIGRTTGAGVIGTTEQAAGPMLDCSAAKRLRRFTSPHTIDLFDFGRTRDGAFYYVMELLIGRDLESLGLVASDRTTAVGGSSARPHSATGSGGAGRSSFWRTLLPTDGGP